jgi:hypothetical protein
MTLAEFLGEIVELLDRAGVQYMVAGSVISSYYGEPRTTRDVDIVIGIDPLAVESFVRRLDPSRFYSDLEPSTLLAPGSMFNVIETQSGWKVDLIVRKDRPFSEAEFARRLRREVLGVDLTVATPEDVILTKLEWAEIGASDQQLDDVSGIIRVQGDSLDIEYLRRWASDLGVDDLLADLLHG